jgi:hypothetical protein
MPRAIVHMPRSLVNTQTLKPALSGRGASGCASGASGVGGGRHGNDVEQLLEPGEVVLVVRVERKLV